MEIYGGFRPICKVVCAHTYVQTDGKQVDTKIHAILLFQMNIKFTTKIVQCLKCYAKKVVSSLILTLSYSCCY